MNDTPTTPPAGEIETANAEETATILAAEGVAEKNLWAEHGALIVAGAPKSMPTKGKRMVIIVENRKVPGDDGVSEDEKATYPKGADIYFGYAQVAGNLEAETARLFPQADGAEVLLMGDNVLQFSHEGLSRKRGYLSVGPAHPVYAAVNLAWQRGARDVKVTGLRDDEIVKLRPWFDEIKPEFDTLEYGG